MGNTVDTKKTVYVPPPAPKKTPDAPAPKKAPPKTSVDAFEAALPSKSTPEQAAWKAYDKHIKGGPPKASDYRNGPLFKEARKEYNDTKQRLGDAASKASVDRLRTEVAATPGSDKTFARLDNRGINVKVLDDKSYSALPGATKDGHVGPEGKPIYIPRSQATKENLLRLDEASANAQPLSLPLATETAKDGNKIANNIAGRLNGNPHAPVEFTDPSGIKVVALKNPQPSLVDPSPIESFTAEAQERGKEPGNDTIINMSFFDPGIGPKGHVVQNGKLIAGNDQPDKFFAAWTSAGIKFGEGDPPADAKLAFGGGVPLIIDKKRYGADNKNGLLADKDFEDLDKRPKSTGKTILAHDRDTGVTYAIVQGDSERGKSLSEIRDALDKLGVDDAVLFDGSDSSTLVRDGDIVVDPDGWKNAMMPYGLNLKVS
ncbi:hypothetical protein MYSTI_04294 [Myxococcus stipitatus DSM 14675]|uniref:Phosphodiester glycosidase domain-containing protein n=1 Tax=Myxococcus stipitatus (strain DSM 14675 / JCM 12634 / Mx s8) TaxID=1278073 RepID=L7UDB1_MYXSD|nr:phosphodiester glycosidase family protein [Myxococcus stipitatus]AGC45592.1 hypothetical protein MYSTI_04294 [Myxococcus stipitatus DSM 14675]